MKVLKNYKKTGEFIDGDFPVINILKVEDVFLELPLCLLDYDREYIDPVISRIESGVAVVVERQELLKNILKLKKFYLVVDKETGKVQEVEPEKAEIAYRLPKDTNINMLVFEDGELLLIENQEVI